MEDFTRELNILLQKYPDLPEFSLTVRPRVTIEIKKSVVPLPMYATAQPNAIDDRELPPLPNFQDIKRLSEKMIEQ